MCDKGVARRGCCEGCDRARGALLAATPDAGGRGRRDWLGYLEKSLVVLESLKASGWASHAPVVGSRAPTLETEEESRAVDLSEDLRRRLAALLGSIAAKPPLSPEDRPAVDLAPEYARGEGGWRLPWKGPGRPSGGARVNSGRWDDYEWAAVSISVLGDVAKGSLVPVGDTVDCCFSNVRIAWRGPKARLVFNLRRVNGFLREDASVVYEYPAAALREGGRFGVKLDLADAFRHVPVAECDRGFLAFDIGGIRLMYAVLPFGLSHAPRMFSLALAPVVDHLRAGGVRLVVYCDDFLVIGDSVASLVESTEAVVRELLSSGWRLSLNKAFLMPMDRVRFLGLIVEFDRRRLTVPPSKAEAAAALAHSVWSRVSASSQVDADSRDDIERLCGLLSFFGAAWPAVGLYRNALDAAVHAKARAVDVGATLAQLLFWTAKARELPGLSKLSPSSVEEVTVVSDASDSGWGAAVVPEEGAPDWVADTSASFSWEKLRDAGFRDVALGQWSKEEAVEGSAVRELRAVLRAIESLSSVLAGKRIRWLIDASAAAAALERWGSSSAGMLAVMRPLFELLVKLGCSVEPTWVRRSLGWQPAADWLTRQPGELRTAEWRITPMLRAWIWKVCKQQWGREPSMDVFASRQNRQAEIFCSRWPELGSRGEAFGSRWLDAAWIFPPLSVVQRALGHFAACGKGRCAALLSAQTSRPLPRGISLDLIIPLSQSPIPAARWLLPASGVEPIGGPPWPLVLRLIRSDG